MFANCTCLYQFEMDMKSWGGFHKVIYVLHLKFALCVHLFSLINHHVLAPYAKLIAFFPRFGGALRRAPNFYEIYPWSTKSLCHKIALTYISKVVQSWFTKKPLDNFDNFITELSSSFQKSWNWSQSVLLNMEEIINIQQITNFRITMKNFF
jgi:hypothetical protein